MKKIKFLLLPLLAVAFFVINTHYVNAEGADILKGIYRASNGTVQVGDEVAFNVEATEEISSIVVAFHNPVSKDGHYFGHFEVDLDGECSGGDQIECTFRGNIPKKIDGYYGTEEDDHIEMTIYSGTYYVATIFVYDKNGNLTRYTTNEEYANESGFLYYPAENGLSGIYIKDEMPKDGPDVLNSITLDSQTNDYYIGDKIIFNVETTEEVGGINVSFYNSTSLDGHIYGYFDVYLTSNDPYNGSARSYSGYIPKTIAGYYGTEENGRSEITIYPGTYEVTGIMLYDKNGKIIYYTTNKEFSKNSEYYYYEPKIAINLKEPTADELNDVNFVLDKLDVKNQTATIGEQVPLDIEYSYDSTNKAIKSIYLIFRDSSKKKTFTSYVKSLFDNPYFIVASSADTATYYLDSIGITFEATDGTNNTIIINGESESGRYAEIFSQSLNVTDDGGSADEQPYFSANELNDEVYKRIQNSKDQYVIIDADDYTIIPLQLFDVIKNSNKKLIIRNNNIEWVFDSANIKVPKDIDVLAKFYEMNNSNLSDSLKKALNGEAIVLEFSNNGELPGDALIRIKDIEMINKLTGNKYYVYYADTENDKLNKVALKVQKTSEGYIEFYINHNSKYVISSAEIKDQTILGEDDSSVEKNTLLVEASSNKGLDLVLLFSIIAVAFVLVAIIIAVVLKTSKKHDDVIKKTIEDENTNTGQ